MLNQDGLRDHLTLITRGYGYFTYLYVNDLYEFINYDSKEVKEDYKKNVELDYADNIPKTRMQPKIEMILQENVFKT